MWILYLRRGEGTAELAADARHTLVAPVELQNKTIHDDRENDRDGALHTGIEDKTDMTAREKFVSIYRYSIL